jgi:hypothetical protein
MPAGCPRKTTLLSSSTMPWQTWIAINAGFPSDCNSHLLDFSYCYLHGWWVVLGNFLVPRATDYFYFPSLGFLGD